MARTRSPDNSRERLVKIRIGLLCVTFLCLVAIVQFVYCMAVGKSKLIVAYHYSGWVTIVAFWGIDFVVMLILAILQIARIRRIRRELVAQSKANDKNQKVSLKTPEEVYEFVRRESSELMNAFLGGTVSSSSASRSMDFILKQLDQMNSMQARLDKLLTVNDHESSLREAQDLLQDIENTICQNVRKVLNIKIAGGVSAFEKAMPQLLDDNSKLLNEAEGILMDLAQFINCGTGDRTAITRRIADYRETISEYLNEEADENEG